MKRYFIEIDGVKIEVTKKVSDEYREVRGPGRRERYVIYELAPKHELSLDGLVECGYPIELHMVKPQKTTEINLVKNIDQEILICALNQLEQNERELIVAIYFEGLSENTVAEYMECTQPTVWYHKQRALEKLKKLLTLSIKHT